ncbi:MAG: ATP-binding cassette domain-containing protein [Rhodospirillales bacterium]
MAGKSRKSIAWLKPVLKPVRGVFREVLLISFFVTVLALAVPVFVMQVYDRVVFHNGLSTLQGLALGMGLVLLFDFLLKQTRARIMQTIALRVDVQVGRLLFEKIMALPMRSLESRPTAFWQTLFRDVEMVRNTLSGAPAVLLADLPFVFLFLLLVMVIAGPIAWVLLVAVPLFCLLAWRSAASLNEANQTERKAGLNRDAMIAEMINGRSTIKALALDHAMRPLWEERQSETIENSIHRGSLNDRYVNLGQMLTLLTTVGLTSVGALAIINQEITMGSLIATNMLSGRLLGPLNQLVGSWRTYAQFKQAAQRLGEVFAEEEELQDGTISHKRPKGEIILENIVFRYGAQGESPVIDGIRLGIKPGGLTAIVGRNGCGKTTLLKLIQGLYKPTEGRVLLDGADISQFTRRELATWIGYVPQECVLFQGTIRDNIAHGRPGSTDEDILLASKLASVHDFIVDLPDGYGTQVGEAGAQLSGGQRQRLAIARALVGNPAVMLLDEPSASLDRQTEEEFKLTLAELARDHTVLVVTHSPILLSACHNVIALDKGKVSLAGPSHEVLPRLFGSKRQKAQATASAVAASEPKPAATDSSPLPAAQSAE